jgi:hypothetical protein
MMRPIDHSQLRIMSQVLEFKEECAANGLRIDNGQAFECLISISDDPHERARQFHHENLRYGHSAGEIHFSNDPDDYFDLPAPNPEEESEDAEEKLNEIMMMCPPHREKIAEVLMEMRRPGGAPTIRSAAQAVGVPRSTFYKMLCKIRRWVARPPAPEGWSGIDCSALVQLDLDLGVVQ